jgi:hypothetical protein
MQAAVGLMQRHGGSWSTMPGWPPSLALGLDGEFNPLPPKPPDLWGISPTRQGQKVQ